MRRPLEQTQGDIDVAICELDDEHEPVESILLANMIMLKSTKNKVDVWSIPGLMPWTHSMTEVLINMERVKL